MRTVALSNQKGGSAKTTTAVNLAAALGEAGQRVLLVDLDPQGSASAWLNRTSTERGIADVFLGSGNVNVADLVTVTDVPGVSLVPASPWLQTVERALAAEVGAETLLRRSVERVRGFDVLLVDCPPSLGLLAVSALVACDEVFVPVEVRTMAVAGLANLLQTVERVRDRLNPRVKVTGILPCRVDARTRLAQDVLARLRERFGPLMYPPIRENVRLAEAPSFHQPITSYAPSSAGAEDYRLAAREFLSRAQKGKRR